MTILLLDTHAYVWALTDPDRLSSRARTAIETPSNVVVVSAATTWEMAIKYRAGKWPEAEFCWPSTTTSPAGSARSRSTSLPRTPSARGAFNGITPTRSTECLPLRHYSTKPRC